MGGARRLDFGAASSAASRQGKGDVGRSQRWEKKKKKKKKKKKRKRKKDDIYIFSVLVLPFF